MAWIFIGMIDCVLYWVNQLVMPVYIEYVFFVTTRANGCWISLWMPKLHKCYRNEILDFNSPCNLSHNTFESQFRYKKRIIKYNSRCILFLLRFLLYNDHKLRFLTSISILPSIEIQSDQKIQILKFCTQTYYNLSIFAQDK